jgi:TPP-dependent 2-oxoacid decarboxylase
MGVGELSAINGIAGAYTEQVKVIHIVGTTATETQSKRLMIHHMLGPNPDHKVWQIEDIEGFLTGHNRCLKKSRLTLGALTPGWTMLRQPRKR